MIEKMKTGVLWILILTSIVLTYLIWTYQPSMGTIEHPEYFTGEPIGEERNIHDVIQPRDMIIHDQKKSFMLKPENHLYNDVIDIFQTLEFVNFYRTPNLDAKNIHSVDGIEIIFPDRLKGEWIKDLLGMEQEDYFPMATVDRINLFVNEEANETEVSVRFISFEEEEIYQVNTNISESAFYALYEGYDEALVEVKPILYSNNYRIFEPTYYVSKEPLQLQEYTFYSETLDHESFKQFLFTDPEFVKGYFQGNTEETYTDGSRMMNIVERGSVLKYIHPYTGTQSTINESTVLEDSINFVNSHAGWTDQYFLDGWHETTFNEGITFRMSVNGLPVMGANSYVKEYYLMELTRNSDQISEYNRSLLEITEEVLKTEIEIVSYEKMLEMVEDNERISLSEIEDATVGYYMRRQGSFIIFEPTWFVKDRGIWKRVKSTEREVDGNGLE